MYVYPIHKIAFARSLHPEDISGESPHGGPVTCLLFLPAWSWVSSSDGAPPMTTAGQLSGGDSDPPLLVSGGMDRTVKIWMPRSRNGSHYMQTLYGHEGKISWYDRDVRVQRLLFIPFFYVMQLGKRT